MSEQPREHSHYFDHVYLPDNHDRTARRHARNARFPFGTGKGGNTGQLRAMLHALPDVVHVTVERWAE
jgi:hypothetical protein